MPDKQTAFRDYDGLSIANPDPAAIPTLVRSPSLAPKPSFHSQVTSDLTAISDGEGRTYGAHLMDGSAVYTTAEILLAVLEDARFLRSFDPATGYDELDIQPLS